MTTPQPPRNEGDDHYGPYERPSYTGHPYPPPQPQPPAPKKKSHLMWIVGAIVAAFIIMVLLLGSCVAGLASLSSGPSVSPVDDSSVEASSTETSATPTATKPATSGRSKANIEKSDIKLHVKILSKKCYGSGIGCNITYRVIVDGAYMDDWPKSGDVEVSYKVVGPEDGPETDSFDITLDDGQYDKPYESYTSTRSRSTKLSVKVIAVEYNA